MKKSLSKASYFALYVLINILIGLLISIVYDKFKGLQIPETSTTEQVGAVLVRVVDGDTVRVNVGDDEFPVRMIGIDAPERGDCGYEWSRNKLTELTKDTDISLEADPSQDDKDKYGRLLRYVFNPSGENINEKMIEVGAVQEYTYDNDYKYKNSFVQAQENAKKSGLGIWGELQCQISQSTSLFRNELIKETTILNNIAVQIPAN